MPDFVGGIKYPVPGDAYNSAYGEPQWWKELAETAAAAISAKADVGHTHDDRYYTEAETDTKLAGKVDSTDARLSDARTPTAHTHSAIANGTFSVDLSSAGAFALRSGSTNTVQWNASNGNLIAGNVPWARLTDVPATFTPATHSHAQADVNGLSEALTTAGQTARWDDVSGKPDLTGARRHATGTFNANDAAEGVDLIRTTVTHSNLPSTSGSWALETVKQADDVVWQEAVSWGLIPQVWRRVYGSYWSDWVRIDAGAAINPGTPGVEIPVMAPSQSPAAYKTVPLALTVGGSATAGPTSGIYRMPIRFGATITRWRAHFRNINPRFGMDGPAVALPSIHFGKATAGQFSETSTRVGSASISTSTAGVATAWQSTPIEAGVEYALSYQFSGTATNRVIGGGWSASSVNSPTATLSLVDRLPLDVWIEAEVAPDVPVIAAFGDSLSAGVGATLPVFDSWLSQWARANGALPVHYAASGDTMAGWADSNAFKWQRWQHLSRSDAVIHAMGSNDVFGGADLSTMRLRRLASVEQLQKLVSSVIYTATIMPRTSSTGAEEDIRRQYNIWLKLFPDAARAGFDFVPAISGDDENISPGFDADGIHLNTAGYAAVAGTITGPLTPPAAHSERLELGTTVFKLNPAGGFEHHAGGSRRWLVNETGTLAEGSVPPARVTGLAERLAVLERDSGPRDVTGLLENGWIAEQLLIRRIGANVYFSHKGLDGRSRTGDTLITLPAEFAPRRALIPFTHLNGIYRGLVNGFGGLEPPSEIRDSSPYSYAAAESMWGLPSAAWPTTPLPGDPA